MAALQRQLDEALKANREFKEELTRARETSRASGAAETLSSTPRKDMSLQAMIAPWSGDETAVPVGDYLNGIELVAECGRWEDKDMALVARMRLKGPAAAFLASRTDLQGPGVPYGDIKEALLERFRETGRPEQFLLQLSNLKQERGEAVRAFVDRCRQLGEKAFSATGTAEERKGARLQLDKMVLASFLSGLKGEIGKHTRLSFPTSLKEAVGRAVAYEEELGSDRGAQLYAAEGEKDRDGREVLCSQPRDEGAKVAATSRTLPGACYRCGGTSHFARGCRIAARTENTSSRRPQPVRCYNCDGLGHISKECNRRRKAMATPTSSPSGPWGKERHPNGTGFGKPPTRGQH